jgi:hypothetical protein
MKVATFKYRTEVNAGTINAGEALLIPDVDAARIAAQYPELVDVSAVDGHYRKYDGQDLTGKSLLLVRAGGLGDLLFLTPLLRHLDRKYEHAGLAIACGRNGHGVFLRNPNVRRIFSYPMRLQDFVKHDYQLFFEGTVEESTDPNLHAVDLMARHAGVDDIGDRDLVYDVDPAATNKAKNILRYELGVKTADVAIGIHVRASSPVRTYPLENTLLVAAAFGASGGQTGRTGDSTAAGSAGYRVFLLGTKRDWDKVVGYKDAPSPDLPGVANLCGRFKSIDMTVAFLARLDLLIGPDSSLVHFAGALGVPTVALYGPFPGAVRTRYYPNCVTLEGRYQYRRGLRRRECTPCFIHDHKPCPRAGADGSSPCLKNLKPRDVVAAGYDVLRERGKALDDPR